MTEQQENQSSLSEDGERYPDDQRAQRLIQQMVDRGIYSISPKAEPNGISYSPFLDLLPGDSETEIKSYLGKLSKSGVLEAKLIDKVISCPACRSASVMSKYNCPRCSSFDIGRASIIEHIRCGYLDSKDKFEKGDILICPKCKGTVRESDYRKIGTSFQCNGCGSRFESPKVNHKCNVCEDTFTYKDALYEPIYEYSLSEQTKRNVAKGTLPLASIVNALKDEGFEISLKADLKGKSGATHVFDVVARKESQLVVANFSFQPKEEEIIGLFAKKYDIEPSLTLLIALTPASKGEEAVSKAYGVQILYATGKESIGSEVLKLLKDQQTPKQQTQA